MSVGGIQIHPVTPLEPYVRVSWNAGSYTGNLEIIQGLPNPLGPLCQSILERRSYTGSPGFIQGLPNLLGPLCQSIRFIFCFSNPGPQL